MIQSSLRTALTALALAAGSPLLVACGDGAPSENVEATGTLNAALLTVGSDGATYQFPAGTTVFLSQGNFTEEFALDGVETVLTLELPVGTYNVQLRFPNGTPQLNRTNGATTTLVDATWLDMQPVTVTIGAESLTDLVLHFQVSGLGDVSFDMGSLAIALEVQRNATTQPAQVWENGTYLHNSTIFGASASMQARTFFQMVPGQSHAHFFDFNINGPWQQINLEMICTSTLLDVFTTEDGPSGFTRAVNTFVGQLGSACIVDGGMDDQFFINTELLGAAPPDQQAFLPSNYRFFLSVSGFVGDVFDGQTFLQSNFESFTPFHGGSITHQIFDNAISEETLRSQGSLSGSVRFVP
jgi:hypothetical protein